MENYNDLLSVCVYHDEDIECTHCSECSKCENYPKYSHYESANEDYFECMNDYLDGTMGQ